jgi:hypothetical protein
MDQVMKDVENTLKKQFGGRIISNKEAESSEDLASKAIMQRQMLQQGPLGAFAKDEQSAARILEAMSKKGKGEPLSNEVLKEVMTKGEQLQQTTNTILNDMLGIMNEARRISDTSNHGFAQTMFAARTGTNDFKSKAAGDIQPAEEESRTNLKQLATDAATKSGDRVRQISNIGKASASEVPVTQNLTADLGRHVGKFGKDAEIALPGMVARIEGMFKSGHVGEARAQAEMYEARIKQAREDSKKIKDPNQKKLEVQKIEDESQKLDLLKQRINQQVEGGMPGKREYVAPADYSATESPLKDALSRLPTDKIGDATKSSIRAAEVAAKTEQEEESSSSGQLATNKRVDVHVETTFEGICIYCRSSMDKKNAHSRGGIANA